MKIQDQTHPITVSPARYRIRVTHGGKTVADTRHAMALQEASYPVVYYIPRNDADMTLLTQTGHASHCPYKGDASYFSIDAGGKPATNAIWSYEAPHPAVAAIAGHLAFYSDRVDSITALPLDD